MTLDISNFNTSNVDEMHYMFYGCESIISLNLLNFETKKILFMDGMFQGCKKLEHLNIINFDTSSVTSMSHMFHGCSSIASLDLFNFNTNYVKTFEYMFSECKSLKNLIINSFKTFSAINMKYFFSGCSSLTSLDLSRFDTSSVTNMEYMFNSCSKLNTIDLSNFKTSFVTNMNNMFSDCHLLENVKISNIDTSSVINMAHMFENCFSLVSINLSSFIFEKTQNIERMFANDKSLVYVNLINADDSKIKKMNDIFLGTLKNMKFCINESLAIQINKIRINKGCSIIDCSGNLTNTRKLVLSTTKKCVDKCPEEAIFFYDYICYEKCPNNTLPEKYICKEQESVTHNNIHNNITNNFEESNKNECDTKNFLYKKCHLNFITERDKQKFIKQIVNDLINGKLYKLVLDVIEGKEIIYVDEGSEVYSIYSLSNKNRAHKLVNVDLHECINIINIKNKYANNPIIVFQMEYYRPEFKIPIVEYDLFTNLGTTKLSLTRCAKTKVNLYINRTIDNFQDYKYNPNNNHYYDKCSPYSNEDNIDLTLQDRRFEFNMNNMSLCESSCTFQGYTKNYVKCECDIKLKFNSFLNTYVNRYNSIYRFEQTQGNSNNFWVLECIFNIFDKHLILSNLISQIVLGIILFSIIAAIIFYFSESKKLCNKIKYFIVYLNLIHSQDNFYHIHEIFSAKKIKDKKNTKNNKIIKNILQLKKNIKRKKLENLDLQDSEIREDKSNSKMLKKFKKAKNFNLSNFLKNIKKGKNHIKYKEYKERTYNELNNLSYNDAIIQDKRTLGQYYISYIMTKQILFFTFSCKNDFNSRIIKFVFLFYSFVIFLFMNTVYVDDSILHVLFIFQGKISISYYIYRIIVITFLSLTIKNILLFFIFTENNVVSLREENETDKEDKIRRVFTSVSIKCYLFFIFNLFSLLFVWVYLTCFFIIFKNTQIFVLKNTLIGFGFSLIVPFVFGFIPCIIRKFALANRESKNRLFTYYLSKIVYILM